MDLQHEPSFKFFKAEIKLKDKIYLESLQAFWLYSLSQSETHLFAFRELTLTAHAYIQNQLQFIICSHSISRNLTTNEAFLYLVFTESNTTHYYA